MKQRPWCGRYKEAMSLKAYMRADFTIWTEGCTEEHLLVQESCTVETTKGEWRFDRVGPMRSFGGKTWHQFLGPAFQDFAWNNSGTFITATLALLHIKLPVEISDSEEAVLFRRNLPRWRIHEHSPTALRSKCAANALSQQPSQNSHGKRDLHSRSLR